MEPPNKTHLLEEAHLHTYTPLAETDIDQKEVWEVLFGFQRPDRALGVAGINLTPLFLGLFKGNSSMWPFFPHRAVSGQR